jgi:undecaprenyl pyrophosphate synthase
MEFKSQELKNASSSPSSITHVETKVFDVENLRNLLRAFVVSKDINLVNIYDITTLNRRVTSSSLENLELLINLLRTNHLSKFKEDKERQIIINLMFDNIISSLKTLKVVNTDYSANEINTILLGFLIKNFI